MAHWVLRRGRYWSLEESYRENGKVKKRVLKYEGRISFFGFSPIARDPDERMAQMMATAERLAEKIDAEQRAKYGETAAERQERVREEARFSQEKFLEETRAPAEEKGPADVAEPAEPTLASESEQPSLPSDEPASSETSGSTPPGE